MVYNSLYTTSPVVLRYIPGVNSSLGYFMFNLNNLVQDHSTAYSNVVTAVGLGMLDDQ